MFFKSVVKIIRESVIVDDTAAAATQPKSSDNINSAMIVTNEKEELLEVWILAGD